MSRLPLNTLPAFRAVAELGSLRAAAEAMHLTHSAISQQIRSLESRLGFPVFERRGRRVELNAAGVALLRATQAALARLEEGTHAAAAAACGVAQRLRISVLPSFAQHWLLPRMGRWHVLHPDIALEVEFSQQVADLHRHGFHAALRQGLGPWPGLMSEQLFDTLTPLVVVGCAIDARRLLGAPASDLLREPLLGDPKVWNAWFAEAGVQADVKPVAQFNDMGLMLQAAEYGVGLTLARELLAADAIRAGRLIKLSPISVEYEYGHSYHLVYPPALADWAPLIALRDWLRDEIQSSLAQLRDGEAGSGANARPA
ncbi:LysR family transcriptional regulator [Allopusillimonas soli]|uniref:LysR family transcriptional regulator n=1 Tax=Allopusillimonas soli TaxID=659016 RepID=A0A853FIM2_9BURK|nr:LysR substrate-binding domain-containing protein [Allopusillimonas soli]NYT38590.1 LysR family transcriptional regulator [Allopusillimonas soli]TEA71695.1 LysR family transcriptional regulator [Allopusillimonas soli]